MLFLLSVLDPSYSFAGSGFAEPSLKEILVTSAANCGEGARAP